MTSKERAAAKREWRVRSSINSPQARTEAAGIEGAIRTAIRRAGGLYHVSREVCVKICAVEAAAALDRAGAGRLAKVREKIEALRSYRPGDHEHNATVDEALAIIDSEIAGKEVKT